MNRQNERKPGKTSLNQSNLTDRESAALSTREIIKQYKQLSKMLPFSSEFLGKKVSYGNQTRRFFRRSRGFDLGDMRADIARFAIRNEVCNSRKKLKKALQANPDNGDLHVLNGILTYCDTLGGSPLQGKSELLKSAVIEIAIAIHNGANSVFNMTWFIKIYMSYLSTLNGICKRLIFSAMRKNNREIERILPALQRECKQLQTLMSIKDNIDAHGKLRELVKRTFYLTANISDEELKQACVAYFQDDPRRVISKRKRASYILTIMNINAQLCAYIPMMKDFVLQIQEIIPDRNRELILKNRMVEMTLKTTEFNLATAGKNNDSARLLLEEICHHCRFTIREFLENAVISRSMEVDPFLKQAWVVREASNLSLDKYRYRQHLENAKKGLEVILGPRGQEAPGVREYARSLMFDINKMISELD